MSKTASKKRLIDSVIELIDLVTTYARKQAKQVVEEGIAKPLQSAGKKVGLFIFAFTMFSLASIFLSVGLFLALASLTGYIIAYLIIGIFLVIIGLVALRQMVKSK